MVKVENIRKHRKIGENGEGKAMGKLRKKVGKVEGKPICHRKMIVCHRRVKKWREKPWFFSGRNYGKVEKIWDNRRSHGKSRGQTHGFAIEK